MTWFDTLRAALEAMRTHRMRSALTVLGILIGIAAVICFHRGEVGVAVKP